MKPVSPSPSPEGRILVIEDDPIVSQLEQMHLRKQGHEVVAFTSGQEGLDWIEDNLPDLMLVDHRLPDMEGTEICDRLQANEATREIPVIMVTAENSPEVAAEYFARGAVDYIRKPFAPAELCARVASTLAAKRAKESLADWKESVSRDLELAGILQQNLASADPLLDFRVRVRAAYLPSLHVGGDFLEVAALSENETLVCVGDVAGHGVAAAMVGSLLKSLLLTQLHISPEAALFEIANSLHSGLRNRISDPSVYATLFLARISHESGEVETLSCGHPDPCLLPKDENLSAVIASGGCPPIGFPTVSDELASREAETRFSPKPGSTLVIYTDGLSEAVHESSGDELGTSGIAGLLEDTCDLSPRDLLPLLLSRAKDKGYQLEDDCSLISVSLPGATTVVHEARELCASHAPEKLAKAAHQALAEAGMSPADADLAQLLILEHFGNVIRHGEASPESSLALQVRRHKDNWELLCQDEGKEWPVSSTSPSLPADPLAEAGRGLSMIESLCDASERYRRESLNSSLYLLKFQPEKVLT